MGFHQQRRRRFWMRPGRTSVWWDNINTQLVIPEESDFVVMFLSSTSSSVRIKASALFVSRLSLTSFYALFHVISTCFLYSFDRRVMSLTILNIARNVIAEGISLALKPPTHAQWTSSTVFESWLRFWRVDRVTVKTTSKTVVLTENVWWVFIRNSCRRGLTFFNLLEKATKLCDVFWNLSHRMLQTDRQVFQKLNCTFFVMTVFNFLVITFTYLYHFSVLYCPFIGFDFFAVNFWKISNGGSKMATIIS